jgi:hypothetical protein
VSGGDDGWVGRCLSEKLRVNVSASGNWSAGGIPSRGGGFGFGFEMGWKSLTVVGFG